MRVGFFLCLNRGRIEVINYVLVFIGGGIGACLRYWMSGAVYRFLEPTFPYGVLTVNVIGSFLIGFMMIAMEDRFVFNPSLRVFLTIGILGGFTTFSSLSYETISLLRESEFIMAALNISANVFLCLGAAHAGSLLGKLV